MSAWLKLSMHHVFSATYRPLQNPCGQLHSGQAVVDDQHLRLSKQRACLQLGLAALSMSDAPSAADDPHSNAASGCSNSTGAE